MAPTTKPSKKPAPTCACSGSNACKIEFTLRYEFDSALVGKLADGVFARIADTMIDAFANRAEAVLGPVGGHDDPPTGPEPGDPS